MKRFIFASAILISLSAGLARQSIIAAENVAPNSKSAVAKSTSWLDERGTLTVDEVLAALGVSVTASQRAQIEKATQERNQAVQAANAQLSAAISKTLSVDDAELAKRVAAERERRRMDIIRQRQPGRYNGMKK